MIALGCGGSTAGGSAPPGPDPRVDGEAIDALVEEVDGRTLDACEPGQWCELVRADSTLNAVWAADRELVVAVGDGRLVWLADGRWRSLTAGGAYRELHDVWGSGPHDVWAVGDASNPVVLHFDGRAWSRVRDDAFMGLDLHAVRGSGPNDVWVVGQYGIVLHFDGTAWTQRPTTGARSFALWVFAPDDAWVVDGYGRVSRWRGERFEQVTAPRARYPSHVWGLAPEELYLGHLRWDGTALRETGVSDELPVIPAWRTGGHVWGLEALSHASAHPRARGLYRQTANGWERELVHAGAMWGTPSGDLFATVEGTIWGRRAPR